MAAAGHAGDPGARRARCPGRHDPAVPHVLGDLRRRAEGASGRDRGGAQAGRRGTADGELREVSRAGRDPDAKPTSSREPRPGVTEGRDRHRRLAGHRRRPRRPGSVLPGTPSWAPRSRCLHSDEPDLLAVEGDITEAETAQRVVDRALERFGRIDSLINNAGVFIGKPFTDYTLEDYAAITAVNLAGFFHITQRAIRQMVTQGSGHVVNVSTSLVDQADSTQTVRARGPHQGRTRRRSPLARHRIRVTWRAMQRGLARGHQDTRCTTPRPTRAWPGTRRPDRRDQRRRRRDPLSRTRHLRHRRDPAHRRRPSRRTLTREPGRR